VVVAATSSPATGKIGTARVFFGDFFAYIKLSQPPATSFFTGKIRRAHGEVVRRKIYLILRRSRLRTARYVQIGTSCCFFSGIFGHIKLSGFRLIVFTGASLV
jgi:hypothetical protein